MAHDSCRTSFTWVGFPCFAVQKLYFHLSTILATVFSNLCLLQPSPSKRLSRARFVSNNPSPRQPLSSLTIVFSSNRLQHHCHHQPLTSSAYNILTDTTHPRAKCHSHQPRKTLRTAHTLTQIDRNSNKLDSTVAQSA